MAGKITDLESPADRKSYGVVKSKGQPRISASGASPSDQKSYPVVKSKGEAPTAHDGVDLSKKFNVKPNTSSRR